MSWGEELWDRYDDVVNVVNRSTKELETFYKGFLKERSKIETEYGKQLRKLIRIYTPKISKDALDEEPSLTHGFRVILEELGYQAGQHELIAESFGKTLTKEIDNRASEVKKETGKLKKEAETLQRNLRTSYKALDDTKLKYQKSHIELEVAKATFEKTEADGSVSRNEVEKMKNLTVKKTQQNDDCKGTYANQLIKTNELQQEHFYTLLPTVLNNFQGLSAGNCDFVKDLLNKCVKSEKDVAPIIVKCHEAMEKAMDEVDTAKDCSIIIDKLKTGNVPPEDFIFEELQPGMEVKANTLRKTSRSISTASVDLNPNTNNYQRKRELEKKIGIHEIELAKVQKEMSALQMMIETYTQSPQFGDAQKFQGEHETAVHKVQILESELEAFKTELIDVNNKLDNLRARSPTMNRKASQSLPNTINRKQIREGPTRTTDWDDDFDESDGTSIEINHSITIPVPPPMQSPASSAAPPPPPPPPAPGLPAPPEKEEEPEQKKIVALYPFDADTPDTISMAEGEEFVVLVEDQDGWTKVQRVDNRFFNDIGEGYIPTSYTQEL